MSYGNEFYERPWVRTLRVSEVSRDEGEGPRLHTRLGRRGGSAHVSRDGDAVREGKGRGRGVRQELSFR